MHVLMQFPNLLKAENITVKEVLINLTLCLMLEMLQNKRILKLK